MFRTLHLHARIRAICTFSFCMTLLLLFPQKAAAWSELLVKGSLSGNDNWTTIATLAKGSDANTWSGTIDASSWKSGDQLSFKLYDSKDDNKECWWGNSGTADMTTNSSSSVTLSNANTWGGNMTLKHNTAYSSYTLYCTYSDNSWTINITGVKSSSGGGGGTTTSVNQPGIYLYGQNFGSTEPNKHLTYKFLRKNDSEYHFALYAGSMKFSVEKYEQNRGKLDITPSWNNWQFKIAYIDADGNVSTFCPSSNYTLTNTDTNASTSKNFGNNTQWTIRDNDGLYDLVVKVDANGKPTSWYYESDPNRIVSYKASSTSNWTTEGFLYCLKNPNTEATAYCNNFFGTVPMVKDEEFKFITGNYWLGLRYDQGPYGTDVAISGDQDAPNLKSPYDGIYPIEYNLTRTNYQLAGNDQTPLRIFMIGSALNSNLSNNYSDWDPANAVELVYDTDEQCYKGTVSLANKGQFRFLRDTHSSGSATSLDLNFGEDANAAGGGVDTDDNNYVAYNSTSTSGTNVVFNPETNIYNVRFYIESGTGMSNFNWNDAKYRYTIELPTRLNATITPTAATVNYAASLTPKVSVVGTNATKRKYAFTIDGSNPTINTTTGEGTDNTVVREYDYDPVVPTNDVYTFYMSSADQLTYIDFDGKEHTLNGNTVTVKAQAVQTITDGSKYRLEGDIATGNYVFKTAGIKPAGSYTISVTNDNTTGKPSINKATATVTVTNTETGKADDGVDVYYTTDGSNPLESTTARLVRDRKVTVYALSGEVGDAGTIKVAIPGTTASASCTYDITYSTSEGGYQNYLNNSASTDKTLGGEGHVVVYVQPYNSDKTYTTSDRQTYVYAYEKKSDGTYASLTPAHRVLADADKTTVNSETWYALDLVPVKDYKEVNVQMGYYNTSDETYKTSDATVANACQDMFLKFDVATGQITDVTRANTGDHFYTIGDNGTKKEAANPVSGKPFFYAQVPLTWTSNSNSLKVFKGETELSDAKVEVQNGAETSDLSSVCKISVPTSLTEKTELTIKPYKGTTPSNVSFTITYQNGGYYFYESAKHYSTTAPLVFSADADGDKDYRSKGHRDINHVTTGDKTHYLANSWTYSTEPESKTTSIADNWNKAASATVNVIPSGTTISQTVNGLSPDSTYTVQMIVRGQNGAKGTMTLEGATTTTDELTLTGYDAQGVITDDGRVEYLLNNDANKNGWQKLEASVKPANDGTVTVKLTADGEEMQLSDVTLLENANIKGHVWTTAPTSNETTEFDLSDRTKANAFSFFDRGDNKNAIVYANANTVLGMSENTYDVAVSNGSTYTMNKLVLTDQAQDGTTASGDVDKFYASGWSYGTTKAITTNSVYFDRSFQAGVKAAVCFPFSLTQEELETMFGSGAKAYNITAVDANKLTVTSEESTNGITANTPCLIEPGADYTASKEVTGSFTIDATPSKLSTSAGTGYTFEASYAYTWLWFNDKEHCYSFDPTLNGRFKYVSKSKGADCKPFRAYIKESNTGAKAKVFKLVISNTTTNIDDVKFEESSHAPIYSITGVLISASGNKEGLHNGVYLQNGKKFIINK